MLVRHGLSDINDDLRRATSTRTVTLRREMFKASGDEGRPSFTGIAAIRAAAAVSSGVRWRRRTASLEVVFGDGAAWSDSKVEEGVALRGLSSGSPSVKCFYLEFLGANFFYLDSLGVNYFYLNCLGVNCFYLDYLGVNWVYLNYLSVNCFYLDRLVLIALP
ncbi:hypothetical protein Dimus_015619 [Dionaea muscipula]